MSRSPWIVHRTENPQARLRLFCFHHAGGAAHVFRTWSGWLPKNVDVCPVQIPGRATRMDEAPMRDLDRLVRNAALGMAQELTGPFAFFGHSLGAILAFQLARELRRRGARGPEHLFIAARIAPTCPITRGLVQLPDQEFIAALRDRYNAIPDEIAREPELIELVLPILRADFELHETYAYRSEPPLDCPITAYGGTRDRTVTDSELEAWRLETNGAFALRIFEGDHFFVHALSPAFKRTLTEDLTALVHGLQAAAQSA